MLRSFFPAGGFRVGMLMDQTGQHAGPVTSNKPMNCLFGGILKFFPGTAWGGASSVFILDR